MSDNGKCATGLRLLVQATVRTDGELLKRTTKEMKTRKVEMASNDMD